MIITRYRWAQCAHIEHVSNSGLPMTWVEVKDPVNVIVDGVPPHPCPACKYPDNNHPGISIMPRVKKNAESSHAKDRNSLNPLVPAFTPKSQVFLTQNHQQVPSQALTQPFVSADSYPDSHQDYYQAAQHACDYANQTHPVHYNTNDVSNFYGFMPVPLTTPSTTMAVWSPSTYQSLSQGTSTTMPSTSNPYGPKKPQRDFHKAGQACPDSNQQCHWHYMGWCHKPLNSCHQARQAIKAAYFAHGQWKDGPMGFNAAHEQCVRRENPIRCPLHQAIEDEVQRLV